MNVPEFLRQKSAGIESLLRAYGPSAELSPRESKYYLEIADRWEKMTKGLEEAEYEGEEFNADGDCIPCCPVCGSVNKYPKGITHESDCELYLGLVAAREPLKGVDQ